MSNTDPARQDRNQYVKNLALAVVAGQVGCLTLIIVLVAVFAGLYLDNQFQSKPLVTILFVIASIPVSVFSMLFVVKKAVFRIQPQTTETEEQDETKEEYEIGRTENP